jgi:hypothetical protein
VQVRLAEELDLAVGLDVAASDGLVELDRVGPLLRRAVAQLAPLPVGVEGAADARGLGDLWPAVRLEPALAVPAGEPLLDEG